MVKSIELGSDASSDDISVFNTATNSDNFIILAVHMPGCGHCASLKLEWDKLVSSDDSRLQDVTAAWVDMSNINNVDILKTQQINGFPFIVGIKNGKMVDFDTNRTESDMIEWIEKNNSNMKGGSKRRRGSSKRRRGGNMNSMVLPAVAVAGYLYYKNRKSKKRSRKNTSRKSRRRSRSKRTR